MTKREEKLLTHLIKTCDAMFASNRKFASNVLCEAQDFIEKNYKLKPSQHKYNELLNKEN